MPANAGYFHAAYVAAAVIYLGYGLTLWRRRRRLAARARGIYGSRAKSEIR
jgi:hypothetical protein